MELKRLPVEAITLGAAQPRRRVEIQQEGESRRIPLGGKCVQLTKQFDIVAARVALVHQRAIGVTIAQHDGAPRERGLDKARPVLGAVSEEQEKLGAFVQRFAFQQPLANLAAEVTGPGLAGAHHFAPFGFKPRRQSSKEGGFAAPFGAFKRDEQADLSGVFFVVFVP